MKRDEQKKNRFICFINLNFLPLSESILLGSQKEDYLLKIKRRLRTLSSDLESRKFNIQEDTATEALTEGCVSKHLRITLCFTDIHLGVGWLRCLSLDGAMQEPKVGVSKCTDSHAFFIGCRIRGDSIGSNTLKQMKKLFILCGLLICAVTVNAQNEEKKNQWAVEAGIGGSGTTTVNLGVRWQRNFHPYVAWDIVTLNIVAPTENLSETLMPQLMTGIHLFSPELAGMKVYMTGRAGYGGMMSGDSDARGDGFTFELGAGINITKHLYAGYAYSHQDLGTSEMTIGKQTLSFDRKVKYHSFRIGWLF